MRDQYHASSGSLSYFTVPLLLGSREIVAPPTIRT
jgi:hypothetical protein